MGNNCPICGSPGHILIGKGKTNSISINFVDKDSNIVKCNNCYLYFVLPYISFSDEQWAKLYNSEYFSNQSNWLIKQRAKELNKRFDKAEYYLTNKNNIKFLDIGTGEGKTLIEGIGRGWEVTGIDIVDNRIENAKSDKIRFIKGKFMETEFHDNYFDIIYLDSVLEHVLNPLEYVVKIKSILKVGGILYIGVPNEDSLFNSVRRMIFNLIGREGISEKLKPFDSPYHVIGFNSLSFKFLIRKIDMDIKLFRNFGRKFDFLSNSPSQKGFWISLFFLFPIEVIGLILNRDIYLEAYLSKK